MSFATTATTYLFTSGRLGFRTWTAADIDPLAELNADPEVMAFFPGTVSRAQTASFVARMQEEYSNHGYCYFAVDELGSGLFIGFIGLSIQTFVADFTPCIDIGWRLHKKVWGRGLATEGAQRCLDFAFHTLKPAQIYAITPAVNLPSIQVMKKIGMRYIKSFIHPKLVADERLKTCVLYVADAP